MPKQKKPTILEGFLSLEPYQQKMLTVFILSGLELNDDDVPNVIKNKAIVGDQSISYFTLSRFKDKLAKLKLTIPYKRILRPEAKHAIAQGSVTIGGRFWF